MWLILSDASDPVGPWLARGLQDLGLNPVRHVTGTQLALARRWEHRLEGEVAVSRVTLADGTILESNLLRGVVNRLQAIPPEFTLGMRAADRDYGLQEAHALLLSWLRSLGCPVVNPVSPGGLSGAWRHPVEWFSLACEFGLNTPGYRIDCDAPSHAIVDPRPGLPPRFHNMPSIEVAVIGNTICRPPGAPDLPEDVCNASVRLARAAAVPLLGLHLGRDAARQWWFLGATLLPDLRRLGAPALAALRIRLQDASASGNGSIPMPSPRPPRQTIRRPRRTVARSLTPELQIP
ncbi:MAG: hypothetical protein JNL10_16535 [Verrucomicrobiales bacterium]|nr:hypothetical protein [Verrucomicrobiales bacterium]